MNTRGYVTLGEIAGRHEMLAIACNRCDRRGRLRLDRLLAEQGGDLPVPALRRILAVDCPRMIAGATARGASCTGRTCGGNLRINTVPTGVPRA